MGIFSSSVGGPSAKEIYKKQNALAAGAIESVDAAQARAISAERARSNIMGMLGQPGTYGVPGTPGAPEAAVPPGAADYYDPNKTFAQAGSGLARAQFVGGGYTPEFAGWESRAGILDPEKYAKEVGKTSQFRQVSQRLAEAEQLVSEQGPMWDRLNKSTYGILAQGSAMAIREAERSARDAKARKAGGAYQPEKEEALRQARIADQNNFLTTSTFNANIQMFGMVRDLQAKTFDLANSYMDSLPELRQSYQDTMSNFAKMMAGMAIPASSEALARGSIGVDMQPKTSALQRVIGGVIGAISGFSQGGGWGGAALGGILGATPELTGAATQQGPAAGAFGQTAAPELWEGMKGMGRSIGDWFSPQVARGMTGTVAGSTGIRG